MPLIIMCGYPVSGKTVRTFELKTYFNRKFPGKIVHVVGDDSSTTKNEIYNSTQVEKQTRSTLKSTVQRLLDADTVVIADSLNYIKGFRYELYCLAKCCRSTHCVIFCKSTKEDVIARNSKISAPELSYNVDILESLLMRFEMPNSSSRWDSPLFLLEFEDSLPVLQICATLFESDVPKSNLSTQSQQLSSANFLYQLDKITQAVVTNILDSQRTANIGDRLSISGSTQTLMLTRPLTLSMLQRYRRQFITYIKMHPVDNCSTISDTFIQFLSNFIS